MGFHIFPPRGVEARPHSWPWVAKIKVGDRRCDHFLNEDGNEDEDEGKMGEVVVSGV